jgi:hypothetical protein
MVEETLLRVTAYDSVDKTSASISTLRTELLPILGKIVCSTAGLDAGGSSGLVVHSDATTARAAPKPRKRKNEAPNFMSDEKYVTLMEAMQGISQAVTSMKTDMATEFAKNKKSRVEVRSASAKLDTIEADVTQIKDELIKQEAGGEEEAGEAID